MSRPPALKKGDKVVILSTARKISREEVAPAAEQLEQWGWEVTYGDHLFEEHHQFAGTVEQRAADLQKALDDPDIRAIFCARGGYGTVQLIDRIDFTGFQRFPKWIVGYSDVTVLHTHIHELFGIETLHATMAVNFPNNTQRALDSLKHLLEGGEVAYAFPGSAKNRPGSCKGPVIGGNLSILYSLTGTTSAPNTKGKILFMEDLDEYLYHIDRMMMNLQRAGMIDELAGLMVGGMTDMNDNKIPYGYTAQESIERVIGDAPYPVCFDLPFGHMDDNHALPMGRGLRMEVSQESVRLTSG